MWLSFCSKLAPSLGEKLGSVYQFVLSEKQTTKMESGMQEIYGGGECWRLQGKQEQEEVRESWTAIQSDTYQRREDTKYSKRRNFKPQWTQESNSDQVDAESHP